MIPVLATPAAVSLSAMSASIGGVEVLTAVDLEIAPGAISAIVGPNGAGKSTLLEVLAGLRRPATGRIERGAGLVAYVPQRSAVSARLPVTVRDIAALGTAGRGLARRSRRDAVDDSLARVGMLPLAARPFSALSGGQRQRALLAQGLVRGADLLLLDEPTTGLDTDSSALIRAALAAERARGAAVVCVTHDDALTAIADRVIRLDAGRVVPSAVTRDFGRSQSATSDQNRA